MRLEAGHESAEGITAIIQNSDPFTYFGRQPLRVCEGVALDNGTLSAAMLRRAAQRDVPTIAARVLSDSMRTSRHRQIDHFEGFTEAAIASLPEGEGEGPRGFPVQVDGDYIGEHTAVELGIEPAALTVVS